MNLRILMMRASLRGRGALRVGVGLLLSASLVASASGAAPLCLRDGRTTRPALMFTEDGLYAFCGCNGATLTGLATVSRTDDVITLEHEGPDRLLASYDTGEQTGAATLHTPLRVGDCDVTDADTTDGGCACDFSCILVCPEDMHVSRIPGKPGVRVPYPMPERSDEACGAVTCNIGTDTLFRQGTTVVRCATEKRTACTFSVTVD